MSKLKSLFHTYVLSDRVTQATQVTKCENLDSRAPWPIYFVQRTSVALSLAQERLNVLNWNSIRRMKLLVLAKASTKWKFVSIPSHFNMFGCCFVLFLVWLTHSRSHLLLLFHFALQKSWVVPVAVSLDCCLGLLKDRILSKKVVDTVNFIQFIWCYSFICHLERVVTTVDQSRNSFVSYSTYISLQLFSSGNILIDFGWLCQREAKLKILTFSSRPLPEAKQSPIHTEP